MARVPYRHPAGDDRPYYRGEPKWLNPPVVHITEAEASPVALYGPKGEPLRYKTSHATVEFGFQSPSPSIPEAPRPVPPQGADVA